MKKIIALCVSSIFVLSLGFAYGEEEKTLNPWERAAPQKSTSAKKDQKVSKAKNRKTYKQMAGKTGMVKKTSAEKTKEPEQKKKFIFW